MTGQVCSLLLIVILGSAEAARVCNAVGPIRAKFAFC